MTESQLDRPAPWRKAYRELLNVWGVDLVQLALLMALERLGMRSRTHLVDGEPRLDVGWAYRKDGRPLSRLEVAALLRLAPGPAGLDQLDDAIAGLRKLGYLVVAADDALGLTGWAEQQETPDAVRMRGARQQEKRAPGGRRANSSANSSLKGQREPAKLAEQPTNSATTDREQFANNSTKKTEEQKTEEKKTERDVVATTRAGAREPAAGEPPPAHALGDPVLLSDVVPTPTPSLGARQATGGRRANASVSEKREPAKLAEQPTNSAATNREQFANSSTKKTEEQKTEEKKTERDVVATTRAGAREPGSGEPLPARTLGDPVLLADKAPRRNDSAPPPTPSLGARLQNVRLLSTLSLRELAKRTGIDLATLGDFERDNAIPSRDELETIAQSLGDVELARAALPDRDPSVVELVVTALHQLRLEFGIVGAGAPQPSVDAATARVVFGPGGPPDKLAADWSTVIARAGEEIRRELEDQGMSRSAQYFTLEHLAKAHIRRKYLGNPDLDRRRERAPPKRDRGPLPPKNDDFASASEIRRG